MINFRPIGKWLSIRFQPPATRTKSGLYLPTPQYSQIATVDAVGDAVKYVKAGDLVMMHKYGDAMETQKSLWYHYFQQIAKNPDVDFKVAPVVVTEDDVFGKWDPEIGLIPHKNNAVFVEFEIPEKVNGIIRVTRHRQNRKPIGEIIRVSDGVDTFKPNDIVLLGKYGGVYFTDLDGKERVLISSKEVLGTIIDATNIDDIDITVGEPKETYDPKAGSEFFNQ